MGKILLKRPSQPHSIFEGFQKLTPIPEYEKLIFMNKEKEKEWEDLQEKEKTFVMNNLRQTASLMESKVAIEMLCHVINELHQRIKKLEDEKEKDN